MSERSVWMVGPCIKDENGYLSRSGEGPGTYPHFLGGIAYWYQIRGQDEDWGTGLPCAYTPERAKEIAEEWLRERPHVQCLGWPTPEEVRLQGREAWTCPGCGRGKLELPTRHDWANRLSTCAWSREPTRWWPDGSIREEEWVAPPGTLIDLWA